MSMVLCRAHNETEAELKRKKINVLNKATDNVLDQACQTYGPRAGTGPLDDLIRPGIDF